MFKLYRLLTHAFGSQRRFVRRIGALCLVLMGVHLAADHLDDVAYRLLDALDLVVDDTVAGFLAWLSDTGGMTPEAALRAAESFALYVDLAEKDQLAIGIALACELVLDILLFDLAWGRFKDGEGNGLLDELRASGRQMLEALRPFDLERLAVVPTLLAYTLSGAVMAALAVEGIARALLQRFASEFLWAGQAAAATGILAAALLLWRFLPDLLHGALLRSQVRHTRARDKAMKRLEAPHTYPRLARVLALGGLASRGTWLLVLALPLAVSGILSHDVLALVQRVEVVPG